MLLAMLLLLLASILSLPFRHSYPAVVEFPFCCWRPCCCSCFRPCRCMHLVLAVDPALVDVLASTLSSFIFWRPPVLPESQLLQYCSSRHPCCFNTSAITGTPAVAGTFDVAGHPWFSPSPIADAQMPMHVASSKRLTVWIHIILHIVDCMYVFVQCMYYKLLTQSRGAFVYFGPYTVYIFFNCISGFLSYLENRRISAEGKSDWKKCQKNGLAIRKLEEN